MDSFNEKFKCRFCGAKVIQTGYKGGQQFFKCTNAGCRSVVTFELDGAPEAKYRSRYLTYGRYYKNEMLDKSVRRKEQ